MQEYKNLLFFYNKKSIRGPSFNPDLKICEKYKEQSVHNSATERKKERARERWREKEKRDKTKHAACTLLGFSLCKAKIVSIRQKCSH